MDPATAVGRCLAGESEVLLFALDRDEGPTIGTTRSSDGLWCRAGTPGRPANSGASKYSALDATAKDVWNRTTRWSRWRLPIHPA